MRVNVAVTAVAAVMVTLHAPLLEHPPPDQLVKSLDDAGDGEAVRWENATSGAGGLLTPLSTSERDGSVCRRLRIQNAVGGQSANSEFDFCRQADGTWKVPPSDASRN